jgi:hypothetical protein
MAEENVRSRSETVSERKKQWSQIQKAQNNTDLTDPQYWICRGLNAFVGGRMGVHQGKNIKRRNM